MRWFKANLRSSIYGLLGHPVTPSTTLIESRLEDIRDAMLALLGDDGAVRHPHVTRRIRYAGDLQGLWYLRGDLMAALAAAQGEERARKELLAITAMFQGVVPGSLHSRPSPLIG